MRAYADCESASCGTDYIRQWTMKYSSGGRIWVTKIIVYDKDVRFSLVHLNNAKKLLEDRLLSALQSLTVSAFHQHLTQGKVLGSGTYAIVKEAICIKTGEYFACTVTM